MTATGPAAPITPGERISIRGNEIRFLVTREQCSSLSVIEYQAAPGSAGPAPHVHETFDEVFYVISGSPVFVNGTDTIQASPGDCVLVPKGTVHTFGNPGAEPARMVAVVSPAGFEYYFKEMYDLLTGQGQPDMAALAPKLQALQVKYDAKPVAG